MQSQMIELNLYRDGNLRLSIRGEDASLVFDMTGPHRLVLDTFAAWLESEDATAHRGSTYRSVLRAVAP